MRTALSEKDLTWDVVGKWTAEDSEAEYSVVLNKVQYGYFLMGEFLFVFSLPFEASEFSSKKLVNLNGISLFTELHIREAGQKFFPAPRSIGIISGERFFRISEKFDGLKTPEFFIAFPTDDCLFKLKDAVGFSQRLKDRVLELSER